jgi:hypothetical protein
MGIAATLKFWMAMTRTLVEDDPSGVQVRKTFGCIHFEKKIKI